MAPELVAPAYLWTPEHDSTWGPDAADLMESVGRPLDPEQRLALDALLARNGSRWAALEAADIVARQNGKSGGVLLPAALADIFLFGARLVVWSAHLFATAQEAFRDVDQLVTNYDHLRREVHRIWRGNGEEAIELRNGARLLFRARSKTGGRGLSGDRVILDEAFALLAEHMGALLPTLSARPDPQVMYGSSAGLSTSAILRGIRDRGRPGGDPSLAYIEHAARERTCATDACDHTAGTPGCWYDDEDAWQEANPALHRRISIDYVRAERRALPPAEFARERLSVWDEPAVHENGIPEDAWAALLDPASRREGAVVFGVDITPDRARSTIGVAGHRADGVSHVEVVDARRGTGWVVVELARLAREHNAPVAIDKYGPAASLIPELQNAPGVRLIELGTSDVRSACAAFYDMVVGGRLRHIGQEHLTDAVLAAARRNVGDGGFLWSRKNSSADISPLYAVTLAAAALTAQPAPADPNVVDLNDYL